MIDITQTKAHKDFLEAGFTLTYNHSHLVQYDIYNSRLIINFYPTAQKYSISSLEGLRPNINVKTHSLIHNMLVELGWVE